MWRTHSCVPCRDFLDTSSGWRQSVADKRRHECRRGTHECAMPLSDLGWVTFLARKWSLPWLAARRSGVPPAPGPHLFLFMACSGEFWRTFVLTSRPLGPSGRPNPQPNLGRLAALRMSACATSRSPTTCEKAGLTTWRQSDDREPELPCGANCAEKLVHVHRLRNEATRPEVTALQDVALGL
jgi:hypothetical protein